MPAPRPWSEDDTTELARRHAEGESLHSIAKAMGRSKDTIGKHAAKRGMTWDRARTAAAASAKHIDAKDRRAALQLALLGDAERLRRELWVEHEYVDHGGRDYIEVRWTTPTPVAADKLKLMQAVNIAVDKSLRLAEFDSGSSEQVRSLLAGMAEQLGLTQP